MTSRIADRVQWARGEANAKRWEEEVEWLKVEIQRARKFFYFYADVWDKMVCLEPQSRVDVGGNAFCRKKSAMFLRLAGQLNEIKLVWASKSGEELSKVQHRFPFKHEALANCFSPARAAVLTFLVATFWYPR